METLGQGSNPYGEAPGGGQAFSGGSGDGSEGQRTHGQASPASHGGNAPGAAGSVPDVMTTAGLSAVRSTVLQWAAGSGGTPTEPSSRGLTSRDEQAQPRALGEDEGTARGTAVPPAGTQSTGYASRAPRAHTPYDINPFCGYPPTPLDESKRSANSPYYEDSQVPPQHGTADYWGTEGTVSMPPGTWSSPDGAQQAPMTWTQGYACQPTQAYPYLVEPARPSIPEWEGESEPVKNASQTTKTPQTRGAIASYRNVTMKNPSSPGDYGLSGLFHPPASRVPVNPAPTTMVAAAAYQAPAPMVANVTARPARLGTVRPPVQAPPQTVPATTHPQTVPPPAQLSQSTVRQPFLQQYGMPPAQTSRSAAPTTTVAQTVPVTRAPAAMAPQVSQGGPIPQGGAPVLRGRVPGQGLGPPPVPARQPVQYAAQPQAYRTLPGGWAGYGPQPLQPPVQQMQLPVLQVPHQPFQTVPSVQPTQPVVGMPTSIRNAIRMLQPFYSDDTTAERAGSFWDSFERATTGLDDVLRLSAFRECLKDKTGEQWWVHSRIDDFDTLKTRFYNQFICQTPQQRIEQLKKTTRSRGMSAEVWGDLISRLCDDARCCDPDMRYQYFLSGLRNREWKATLSNAMVDSIPQAVTVLLYKNMHLPVENDADFEDTPQAKSQESAMMQQMLKLIQQTQNMLVQQPQQPPLYDQPSVSQAPPPPIAVVHYEDPAFANAPLTVNAVAPDAPVRGIRQGPDMYTQEGRIVCGRCHTMGCSRITCRRANATFSNCRVKGHVYLSP